MCNFIKHFNDSTQFYDLNRARKIDLSVALSIILVMDDASIETETFSDETGRTNRMQDLLSWAHTTGPNIPN